MRHSDANNMIPSPPTICIISRFSTKWIVMFHMSLTAKKVDYIFEEPLNSNIIVPGENRAKLDKLSDSNSRLNWFEDIFWFVSDCWNSLNCKKFTNEQTIIFYSPSNALSSSDECIQIKHFKHHIFIGMCSLFTWFNLQILNFC